MCDGELIHSSHSIRSRQQKLHSLSLSLSPSVCLSVCLCLRPLSKSPSPFPSPFVPILPLSLSFSVFSPFHLSLSPSQIPELKEKFLAKARAKLGSGKIDDRPTVKNRWGHVCLKQKREKHPPFLPPSPSLRPPALSLQVKVEKHREQSRRKQRRGMILTSSGNRVVFALKWS